LTWQKDATFEVRRRGCQLPVPQRRSSRLRHLHLNGGFTGGGTAGGFPDFLLGMPQTMKRSDPFVNRTLTNKELGFYIMDTFKLTPRLTLDYGLRWDYYALPTYTDGLMYNFDLSSGAVLVPQNKLSQVNTLYPAAGSPACAKLSSPDFCVPVAAGQVTPEASLKNFRPRIAAAYLLATALSFVAATDSSPNATAAGFRFGGKPGPRSSLTLPRPLRVNPR